MFFNLSAQTSEETDRLNREIKFHLNKNRKLKTTGWIVLGGGYLGTAALAGIASTARQQEVILIGGLAGTAVATYLLMFKASDHRNFATLLKLERELLGKSEADRKILFDEAVLYFKDRAQGNRIAAILLSAFGGIGVVGALTLHDESSWVPRELLLAAGFTYIGASVPFHIRARKLKLAAETLEQGRMPSYRLGKVSPAVSTNGQVTMIGLRIDL